MNNEIDALVWKTRGINHWTFAVFPSNWVDNSTQFKRTLFKNSAKHIRMEVLLLKNPHQFSTQIIKCPFIEKKSDEQDENGNRDDEDVDFDT